MQVVDPAGLPSTDVLPKPPTLTFADVQVRVVAGPDAGRELRLEPGKTRIGTAASCGLRLSDAAVSRLHCELRVEPDGVRVVDSGSTNGTWVNGLDVGEARLAGSARIDLGKTTLAVDILGEPIEIALAPRERFGPLIGTSAAMRQVFHLMATVAPTHATVLFQGETGTGKELAAQAIHEASRRAAGPFVAVNCGAIAEHLIESELFGHLRGAFTGATSNRAGLFEAADGGTLFLDEIGELPLSLQPKLLRALEEREVRPVGSNTARQVDVRVVAATNRPLARAVNDGSFREDLYYRLAVFEIVLPPLRERKDDLAFLANHFYARSTGSDGRLPPEALAALYSRSWPGNVRELRNFVERSAILGWGAPAIAAPAASAPTIGLDTFASADLPLKEARERCLGQFEALYVAQLLRRTGGNVTRAAEIAGVSRRYLHRLISERGLRGTAEPDEP
ncbi:MAG TPA: sigma 54-interacting transcriptional regulator [Kofleriaceae bacterium]|nr:sigma 54-interacting transcriptional regulator [Kofleriaceae bacterium]